LGALFATDSKSVVAQLLNIIGVILLLAAAAVASSPSLVAILWNAVAAIQMGEGISTPRV